jgi:hypothetical protein
VEAALRIFEGKPSGCFNPVNGPACHDSLRANGSLSAVCRISFRSILDLQNLHLHTGGVVVMDARPTVHSSLWEATEVRTAISLNENGIGYTIQKPLLIQDRSKTIAMHSSQL